ncbi:unnamed protein product [Acanthosepion pharaonis]|uniref:Uncharacterized protein n=1 Tax=Acanthosepion pharaonis TaxID=158019 RepID=A0A812E8F6_ACAPH|nr:unnamed protein product [Sepia pharaonis]
MQGRCKSFYLGLFLANQNSDRCYESNRIFSAIPPFFSFFFPFCFLPFNSFLLAFISFLSTFFLFHSFVAKTIYSFPLPFFLSVFLLHHTFLHNNHSLTTILFLFPSFFLFSIPSFILHLFPSFSILPFFDHSFLFPLSFFPCFFCYFPSSLSFLPMCPCFFKIFPFVISFSSYFFPFPLSFFLLLSFRFLNSYFSFIS